MMNEEKITGSSADIKARAEKETPPANRVVSFREAFRFWLKLGFISFGGPAGQIAIMHKELVDKRRWLSDERFLHALNYCMLLPGPEAQQLAIYIGWLMHRTWGGIVAGAFFVIPSIFILLALSYVYAAYGNVPAVAGVLEGLTRLSSPLSSKRSSRSAGKLSNDGRISLLRHWHSSPSTFCTSRFP